MSSRPQLGWRVPADVWAAFQEYVAEKHASDRLYLQVEMENAMMEFLDEDDLLARAESLLREHTDLQGLSSSTVTLVTDRYQGQDTKLLTHRVREDLKERFAKFADKHDAPSYGRLLAAALDSYADGGRAQRILDDVERLVTGATSSGSTDDSVENVASTGSESGSTDGTVESSLSTATAIATSSGSTDDRPNPNVVIDVANELLDRLGADDPSGYGSFPGRQFEAAVGTVIGDADPETLDTYRDPVLEQINAEPHPHRDDFYLSEIAREQMTLWADLDKAERLILLRRWATAKAIENGNTEQAFSYREVTDLFEFNAGGGGPSHQYAYELMEEAAEEDGFRYGEFKVGNETGRIQLRVNVNEVSDAILQWVKDERDLDPSSVGVNADVTSWSAGNAPSQEVGADDD